MFSNIICTFLYYICLFINRWNTAAYVIFIVACLFTMYEVLLEAVISNSWFWLLLFLFSMFHIILYLFDRYIIWNITLFQIVTFDIRWLLVYLVLPLMFLLLSQLAGCESSLPESKGIKLSRRAECTYSQFIYKCIDNIYFNSQCHSITC